MFNLFKKTPVYVKFYPDKIEMVNLKTGEQKLIGFDELVNQSFAPIP